MFEDLPQVVRASIAAIETDYSIVNQDNNGANGYTFFARNRLTDQQVAIKFYSAAGGARHDEPRLLASVQSHNVLPILDARSISDEWAFFITPRCTAGNLDDWIATNPSATQSIDAMLQICGGVAAIHAAGLVHRDLKPANIVVEAGIPLIADFGSVRELDVGEIGVHASGHSILYRPPECFGDGRYTVAGDVYQLGLIAYQVMGGSLPYEGTKYFKRADRRAYKDLSDRVEQSLFTDQVIRQRSQAGDLVQFSTLAPWFRQTARPMLRRLLATDPNKRFPAIADVAAALNRLRGRIADWRFIGADAHLVKGNKYIELRKLADGRYQAFSRSKYPPAKPGALGCEPLKAAERGR